MKLFQGVVLLLASLKLDGILHLHWGITLIPLLILGLFATVFTCIAGDCLCRALQSREESRLVVQVWLFLVLLYAAAVGLGWYSGLVVYLDTGKSQYLIGLNYFLVCFSLCIAITTIAARKYLE